MPKLILPPKPAGDSCAVAAWREAVTFGTYPLHPPNPNPMFLERRVYQGSSGKVYPLPFYERVAEVAVEQSWDAIHIENKYLRLMILPQLGGRIHVAMDKTNGYDFIYRQDVIKPALVGLAGPWISGGIEFNWPQHHRPSTYMPCDVHIESHDDGSKTVWLSEYEPMNRMKGMHGVCLHPDRSYIELKVRLYNRTELTQTFLWWANVATRVHEKYQSFFPSDVTYVADHAKRAMSSFPLCDDHYYGVNYGERAQRGGIPQSELPLQFVPPPGMYRPNDLSWYANIPVPTSYMCIGTNEDFFGGYDHAARAGIVHVADHHISPGKKQWTWGNHDFGYAWDRNLTDPDENGIHHPYIELMAGVFTDNQPDFSFLAPGETRAFSQYWYPIRDIGPATKANVDAAISLREQSGTIALGVCVTAEHRSAMIVLWIAGLKEEWSADLAPDEPFLKSIPISEPAHGELALHVFDRNGRELISHVVRGGAKDLAKDDQPKETPSTASAIPPPEQIESLDELYISGLHLEQYRHATRRPELYWREALRRDPMDSRCNNAIGLWHLRRGEFSESETHFRRAIERLTQRNPNPRDGEPFYNLGLALRYLERHDEAYDAFYKSTWTAACRASACFCLAELDCRGGHWLAALAHLDRVLKVDAEHLQARNLKAIVLQKLDRAAEATSLLHETLTIDLLDLSARFLLGQKLECDTQARLDLSIDYDRAGLTSLAIAVLKDASSEQFSGTAPLLHYYRAVFYKKLGHTQDAHNARLSAATADPAFCFPSRLSDIAILKHAIAANPLDARAPYYLGNLLYDRQRYEAAIECWEQSIHRDPSYPTAWRNLGIAYFNLLQDPTRAKHAYEKAIALDPHDARLLYERDQLRKRMGESPKQRLAALQEKSDCVRQRDDLTIELCALYNLTGQHQRALEVLSSRRFQPWEGGEGLVLAQYVTTQLALGRAALRGDDASAAKEHFQAALNAPENLGETKHLLANQSDVHYWLGIACDAAGDTVKARDHFTIAANASGDFQNMSVRPYSEMSLYTALSLHRLGEDSAARSVLTGLSDYAKSLMNQPATIDYFATSLPSMLLFNEDLKKRQVIQSLVLKAQALIGMHDEPPAQGLLDEVLTHDPNHAVAVDLRRSIGRGPHVDFP